jgi:peptide deformylase
MLVCPSGEPGDEVVVIDPQITSHVGSEVDTEGCLSFPGIFGEVERARKVHVKYRDLSGRPQEMDLEGFVARVFQHEFDHLEGRVFIDRMLPASRAKVEDRLEEQRRGFAARAV